MARRPDSATLAREIADARRSLVETLSGLREADWDAPSLCAEWAVRDVVGHLVHQYRIYRRPVPPPRFAISGFRVNRFLSSEARRIARAMRPDELLEALEGAAFERTTFWKLYPSKQFALSEFVVHAQDIRRPLGLAGEPTRTQIAIVADVFARPKRGNPFITKLPPTRYEATDAEWSYGSGPSVRGPLEAIVMVLAGRRQALDDLSGDGVAQLDAALSSR